MRAAAAAAVLLTGCFYVDPIITRPRALIDVVTDNADSRMASRDSSIMATARFDDGRPVGSLAWSATACGKICDDTDLPLPDPLTFQIKVPLQAADGQLVTKIQVKVDARDDRGAFSSGEEEVMVTNGLPSLALDVSARTYTVGAPIDVFARFGDPELSILPGDLVGAITWSVTPATSLVDIAVPPPEIPDRTHSTFGKRFVPQAPGDYTVTATAQDAGGNTTTATMPLSFPVTPDQPPCLAQWQPAVPPLGQSLPVSEPTVFQVPLVADDLDPFPQLTDEPPFGTATFEWSILLPGETQRRPVADPNVPTGNRIRFDPGAFTPGDIVELRVEIFDRNHTRVACDDSAATCAITADATCLQRQTWRVEAR